MIGGAIDLILAGERPDPDGGPALKVPTRRVVIEKSLAGDEAELVRGLDFGRRLAVISDATTRAVLGQRVERVLAAVAEIVPVPLPGRPRADLASVAAIRRAAGVADALIAVGAGTINDLAKYAAWLDGKPYAVFGTAPSMNGYASATASIAIGGVKKSLPAAAPAGIFFDLSILAAAPVRLIRAGLGDSLARATAQADWLLAHLVLGRPYRSAPFRLLAEEEEALFSAPEALIAGDLEAMAHLARTLVLSGFGMAVCGGSHPASQGEHLISHYMEMRCAPDLSEPLHGEQIGVTTLTMARLQE
ncbi:MAG: iron-containing alcohol dehydrogenase, partial [Pseudomonadota bacterium]